jgi:predicted RNA-binding protein
MCMAIVYSSSGGERKEAMRDVIYIDAENTGFRLTNLSGEERYVQGKIKSIDFWQDHTVVIEQG